MSVCVQSLVPCDECCRFAWGEYPKYFAAKKTTLWRVIGPCVMADGLRFADVEPLIDMIREDRNADAFKHFKKVLKRANAQRGGNSNDRPTTTVRATGDILLKNGIAMRFPSVWTCRSARLTLRWLMASNVNRRREG